MIKTDKIRKPQPVLFYIIDYLWSGFTGLSVAMIVVALWAWGSSVFGEFMLPAPSDVFQKALELLDHFQQNENWYFVMAVCGGHYHCISRWLSRWVDCGQL